MGLIGAAGAKKAASQQAEAMKKIAGGYKKLGQWQYQQISPWMQAGTQALSSQMQMLQNPLNSQAALSDYYSSPQYAMQEQQAQYATQAGAEAAGGLGGSATSNVLASQSTQLGQQYLQGLQKQRSNQFSQLGGISSQGLGATKTMGGWAYQDYNAAAQALGASASASAQATQAPYTGWQQFAGRQAGMASYGMGLVSRFL